MFFYFVICFTQAAITKKSLKDIYSKYLVVDFDIESGQATGLSKEKNNMFYQLVYQKGFNEQTITKDNIFLIWLQGGPGCSSQSALYELIGPFHITKSEADFTIEKKSNSWNDFASILFIDQPFGTGFSQADIQISSTQQASTYFVEFMVEFFKIHPEFTQAQTYLTGFSYTGHFALQFSTNLLANDIKFNYKGIIIGNGLQSLLNQLSSVSQYLYVNGYLSNEFNKVSKKEELQIQQMILKYIQSNIFFCIIQLNKKRQKITIQNSCRFGKIFMIIQQKYKVLMYQDRQAGEAFIQYSNKLENLVKTDLTNIQLKHEVKRSNDWINFMSKYKDQFGISNTITEVCNQQVKQQMESDFSFDLTKNIEELLNKGTVLLYDGQMDATINIAGTYNWISSLKSQQIYEWKSAQKSIFREGGKTVGNFKKAEKFTTVTIYNAGHAAVLDQPQVVYQMMKHHLNNDQYWT